MLAYFSKPLFKLEYVKTVLSLHFTLKHNLVSSTPFNIRLQDFLRARQSWRDRCDERAGTREVVSLATVTNSKLL